MASIQLFDCSPEPRLGRNLATNILRQRVVPRNGLPASWVIPKTLSCSQKTPAIQRPYRRLAGWSSVITNKDRGSRASGRVCDSPATHQRDRQSLPIVRLLSSILAGRLLHLPTAESGTDRRSGQPRQQSQV